MWAIMAKPPACLCPSPPAGDIIFLLCAGMFHPLLFLIILLTNLNVVPKMFTIENVSNNAKNVRNP